MFDYLIKNGTIIDGTGDARFQGDIAIQDDRIVAVGTIDGEAKEIIDATGLVVAPVLLTLIHIMMRNFSGTLEPLLQIFMVLQVPLWEIADLL